MKHVELTVFENQSILHEKGVTLPVGLKVSFRQLGILTVGVLVAFVGFFITKDFIAPGIIIAIALGFGLPNTKIMTPDQKVKSMILFLVRGTSLAKKPEHLKKNNDTSSKSNKKENKYGYNKKIQAENKNQKFTIQNVIDYLDIMLNKNASDKPTTTSKDKLNTIKISRTKNKIIVKNLNGFNDKLFFGDKNEFAEFVVGNSNAGIPINIKKKDSVPIILNEDRKLGDYKTDKHGNLEISFDDDYLKYEVSIIVDGYNEVLI